MFVPDVLEDVLLFVIDVLQGFGLSKRNFTLTSPSCPAIENATHIILSTHSNACGTITSAYANGADVPIYQNAVCLSSIKLDRSG
jgi:hypothetical protein